MNWTIAEIEKRLAAGTIRSYEVMNKAGPVVKVPKVKKEAKQVSWIREQLQHFEGLLKYKVEEEYRFHKKRKWRFDFAIPELKIAIEYEGLNSEKSGHTTLKGYTSDTEKYNEAQQLGWKVIRYTVLNYNNVIIDLRLLLAEYIKG